MPRLRPLLASLLASLSLSALPAHAEVALLTSIKPLQLIAGAVQAGIDEPGLLLPAGASPHHYSLRPSDVRQLRQADLFYWIGPDLESFLAKPLDGRDGPALAVQTLPGLTLRHFGEHGHGHADESHEAHEHEHEHEHEEHAHDDHEAHGEHDHAHRPGSLDAHLWLDPHNARVIAHRMAADLAEVDPANAQRYQANLKAFEQRLDALDTQLKQSLAAVEAVPFFVFHETYDYFEAAYGLEHTGVFALGEVQPGARQVADMRERLREAGPSCVFSEPPVRPRLTETLTEGLPVRLAELDAMGLDLAADANGYPRLLERLAAGLTQCLTAVAEQADQPKNQ